IGTGGGFSRILSAGTHTITATARDTSGKTGSRSVTVTVQGAFNNPPVVTILAPSSDATFGYGSSILFAGTAVDLVDGDRSASLVWYSSIDGRIGTGSIFFKVLSPGTHTLTASATDSGGRSGSRSITVTVPATL